MKIENFKLKIFHRITNTPTIVNMIPNPIAPKVISAVPERGSSDTVGRGVLVGTGVEVGLGVDVGPGVRVAAGVAVGPGPPIVKVKGFVSAHFNISAWVVSQILLSVLPVVQSKERVALPAVLAVKVTVPNKVSADVLTGFNSVVCQAERRYLFVVPPTV